MYQRSKNPVFFFSKKEKQQIAEAIGRAEGLTSAEIRVHLDRKSGDDVLVRAREIFEKIGMTKTAERNGVLIFLDVKKRRFAILGDTGIHEKVPPGFWETVVKGAETSFREDRFAEGIVGAVSQTGEKLKTHFPRKPDDKNELHDGISYSL